MVQYYSLRLELFKAQATVAARVLDRALAFTILSVLKGTCTFSSRFMAAIVKIPK